MPGPSAGGGNTSELTSVEACEKATSFAVKNRKYL